MKEIRITRAFLKKPLNSVLILLGMVVSIEALGWSIAYPIKVQHVANEGGPFQYINLLVRSLFISELFTLFTTITLINRFHSFRRIHTVENTWRSISRYELRFLPLLAFAFLVFNPITQTIRYFLESGPDYSWKEYLEEYIMKLFKLSFFG